MLKWQYMDAVYRCRIEYMDVEVTLYGWQYIDVEVDVEMAVDIFDVE